MDVFVNNVGKKFTHEYIIKNVSHHFSSGSVTGIQGANGSGKSTLLRLLSSVLTPSTGTICYSHNNKKISREKLPQKIGFVAPAIQLIPELTLEQTLNFHFTFLNFLPNQSFQTLLEKTWLTQQKKLKIGELSSGMRQRLLLGMTFFSDVDLILLDEPTSNLDKKGITFFHHLVDEFKLWRTVIIASNEQRDLNLCETILSINQWKSI